MESVATVLDISNPIAGRLDRSPHPLQACEPKSHPDMWSTARSTTLSYLTPRQRQFFRKKMQEGIGKVR